MLFDSPAEIRKQNYVGEWKSQCSLSWKESSKLKDRFLKPKARKKQYVQRPCPLSYMGGASYGLFPGSPTTSRSSGNYTHLWSSSSLQMCLASILCVPDLSAGGRFASAALLESPWHVHWPKAEPRKILLLHRKLGYYTATPAIAHSVGMTVAFSPSFFYPSSPIPSSRGHNSLREYAS